MYETYLVEKKGIVRCERGWGGFQREHRTDDVRWSADVLEDRLHVPGAVPAAAVGGAATPC